MDGGLFEGTVADSGYKCGMLRMIDEWDSKGCRKILSWPNFLEELRKNTKRPSANQDLNQHLTYTGTECWCSTNRFGD